MFVGRRPEMSVLAEDLTAALRGEGRVVVVSGEAGIGKTRLLEEALGGTRARVLRGAAEELSGNLPFGVVVDALGIDLRAAPLGRLLLTASGESAETGRLSFRVSEALLAHVDDLCADGPLALVLEDLHWADASSLVLIARLARRAPRLALLLVVTRRPSPERPALDRLVSGLGDGLARRIVLGPLSGDDVHAIAEALLGAEPGERLVAHLAGAAGNPLFVTELLDAMQRSGDLVRDSTGRVDVVGGLMPTSFAILVLHRLSFLPAPTIDALRVAALLGATFSVTDLSRVMPLSPSAAVLALRPTVVAGVLEDAGARFRFRHDLIREALYLDIPGPLRTHLHLEVARALIAVDAPPERVAEHLLRGASPDDRTAGPALRVVAGQLALRAPGLAADVLGRAVEVAGSQAEREGLLVERAQALWAAGRLREAAALCRSLLSGQPHPEARLCLAQVLVAEGRAADAAAAVSQALSATGMPAALRARLLAWGAWAHVSAGDLAAAERQASQVERLAKELGEHQARLVALATRAAVAHLRGHFPEAIELTREGLGLDRRLEADSERFPLHLLRASILYDGGHLEAGNAALARALTDCDERGTRWALPGCHRLAARGFFLAGRWDDALVELDAAATLAEEVGSRPSTEYGRAVTAVIAIHRGDLPRARAALATAPEGGQLLAGQPRPEWELWARALLAEASGDAAGGLARLEQAWELCIDGGIALGLPLVAADLVRLALAEGDRARAGAASEVVAALVGTAGTPAVRATARRCQGLATSDPAALLDAVDIFEASGRPLDAAQASEEAAVLLAALDRNREARPLFDGALERYEALGAVYDTARVQARLRALGVRRGRSGPRGRPRHGWASLTGTERTVAALVAEGLSNRQIADRLFLSPHTVHTHVSHILAKLGLASRVELATEALRHRSD